MPALSCTLRLVIRLAAALLLLCLALASSVIAQAPVDLRPTVILISFDGWRWDYDARYEAPNVRRLAARGVRAANLIPSFPSKTFPNHYTLVTGRIQVITLSSRTRSSIRRPDGDSR